jgi:hypothetical protein
MKIKIPVTIEKRRITLFNQNENTGNAPTVKENHIPRQLDYMFINYGDIDRNVATLKSSGHLSRRRQGCGICLFQGELMKISYTESNI